MSWFEIGVLVILVINFFMFYVMFNIGLSSYFNQFIGILNRIDEHLKDIERNTRIK